MEKYVVRYEQPVESFGGGKRKKKALLRGGAHGGCLQDLEICENTLAEGGGRKNMTWICVWVLRFVTTSFELRAIDRGAFYHISPRPAPRAPPSLSHHLRRHRSRSRHPARCCVSFFCVLRDEHLAIDRLVYTAAMHLAT